jgi:hypothetical protein
VRRSEATTDIIDDKRSVGPCNINACNKNGVSGRYSQSGQCGRCHTATAS